MPVADGDLCVEIRMAVSLTKAGHRRQADIDNCVKSILDGLNGIAWEDDAQVRRLVVDMEDVNAETGEVEVIIESKAVHAET